MNPEQQSQESDEDWTITIVSGMRAVGTEDPLVGTRYRLHIPPVAFVTGDSTNYRIKRQAESDFDQE